MFEEGGGESYETHSGEEKKSKSPKKKPIEEVIVSKLEAKPVATKTDESPKEVVPSKTEVFKRLKKIDHRLRSSSDRSPSFSPSMVQKPHVTWKGVVIREILVPISPSSKSINSKIWLNSFRRNIRRNFES
ncbi:unnamed protein product [Lactuca saligna]|uniref:Uncharacterized protein n=1 Tax=Lactuca saligna TaxID=75948 RepID=A0AA35VAE0_LACSI|nr:unnamed protein product [Lactuca saligna]